MKPKAKPKTEPKTITVTVTRKHFTAANKALAEPGIILAQICPVAQALMDVFSDVSDISVGPYSATLLDGARRRYFDFSRAGTALVHRFDSKKLRAADLPVTFRITEK